MRILPRTNDLVQWISDKTRFAFDGLKYQRLVYPMFASQAKQIEGHFDKNQSKQ
jgi:NADH dehydrogenase/NADH:ubiquinone oxidoreductase subunit G